MRRTAPVEPFEPIEPAPLFRLQSIMRRTNPFEPVEPTEPAEPLLYAIKGQHARGANPEL